MIERILRNYLEGGLKIPVRAERPEAPPDKYVVVTKTGSGRNNYINSAVFAIQSYAPSMYEAMELNEQVKELMADFDDIDCICSAKLNSDYNFTDLSTKSYRYQAVFDITHY